MQYCSRPWPMLLQCCISNIESLQQAFPNTIVGNDLAYAIPSGLLGLLVAIAAFMSTISTHLFYILFLIFTEDAVCICGKSIYCVAWPFLHFI